MRLNNPSAAINRCFGSRKSQKNLIYLYILVIFLSTFSFYTILQIESEKESKSKYKNRKKLIKTQTKSEENVDIPNLPPGKKFYEFETTTNNLGDL